MLSKCQNIVNDFTSTSMTFVILSLDRDRLSVTWPACDLSHQLEAHRCQLSHRKSLADFRDCRLGDFLMAIFSYREEIGIAWYTTILLDNKDYVSKQHCNLNILFEKKSWEILNEKEQTVDDYEHISSRGNTYTPLIQKYEIFLTYISYLLWCLKTRKIHAYYVSCINFRACLIKKNAILRGHSNFLDGI